MALLFQKFVTITSNANAHYHYNSIFNKVFKHPMLHPRALLLLQYLANFVMVLCKDDSHVLD